MRVRVREASRGHEDMELPDQLSNDGTTRGLPELVRQNGLGDPAALDFQLRDALLESP